MINMEEKEVLRQLNEKKIREYAPAIAFSALIVVLGIIGNAMSVIFYGFKVPRTTTNIIITALATVDLVTCVVLSDEIIELCFTLTFKNVGGCKAMYFFNHSLVLTSGFMLLFVAFDRFRKICRPFRWQLSTLTAKIYFFAIVLIAIALSVRDWVIIDVVPVEIVDDVRNNTINVFYCTHTRQEELQTVVRIFQVIDLLTFIVDIGGTLLLYAFISKQLWKSRKHVNRAHGNDDTSSDIPKDISTVLTGHIDSAGSDTTGGVHVKGSLIGANIDGMQQASAVHCSTQETTPGCSQDTGFKDERNKKEHSDSENRTVEEEGIKEVLDDNHSKVCVNVIDKRKEDTPQLKKRSGVQAVERKVTIMMLTVTAISLLSFVPYFIVNLWIKQNSSSSAQEFNVGIQIALRSYMINNAVNPYIMGLFNSKFRTFVRTLLCKSRICRKCRNK